MSKEEFYGVILGKTVTMTGGCGGLGFSMNGVISNIVGDVIMIDDNFVDISSQNVQITQDEEDFHVKLDNGNLLFVAILDNIKQM